MKSNIFKILVFIIFISFSFIQIKPGIGQLLSRQDYQTQLLHAVAENDGDSITKLLKTQRIDGIRLIESLLDSAVVQTARHEIKSAYSGSNLPPIPVESCRSFRFKPATYSG